jgi:hypothetical protein
MYLLPAIDILGGKAVRLAKGDYDRVTVYNDDPVAQARAFEQAGAHWVHVVDLDGARSGMPEKRIEIVERIVAETHLMVEVGGGIRSIETLERLRAAGASRAILGTALVRDEEFARAAVERFGDFVGAGIDAKNGEAAVDGWRKGTSLAGGRSGSPSRGQTRLQAPGVHRHRARRHADGHRRRVLRAHGARVRQPRHRERRRGVYRRPVPAPAGVGLHRGRHRGSRRVRGHARRRPGLRTSARARGGRARCARLRGSGGRIGRAGEGRTAPARRNPPRARRQAYGNEEDSC